MKRPAWALLATGCALAAACAALAAFSARVLPSCLAAWLFCLGPPIGALPALMALEMAGVGGGQTATALRRLLIVLPLALLLSAPVLLGLHVLYGWANVAHNTTWLTPAFFDARTAFYIACWAVLAFMLRRPPQHGPRFALCATGLIATTSLATLAANDWIGSVDPGPDQASLGILFLSGQSVIALAASRFFGAPPSPLMPIAGLVWGFLAFTRYLTVWSADKPHEILWYAHRQTPMGQAVSWFSCGAVILSMVTIFPGRIRQVSGAAAGLALIAHAADLLWIVTPGQRGSFMLTLPDGLAMLAIASLAAGLIALVPSQGQPA
jgi:hypothetical protein